MLAPRARAPFAGRARGAPTPPSLGGRPARRPPPTPTLRAAAAGASPPLLLPHLTTTTKRGCAHSSRAPLPTRGLVVAPSAAASAADWPADDNTARRRSPPSSSSSPSSSVAPTIAAVLAAGVLNRVLYRMALVPMAAHTFALAQFQNASYVVIYSLLVVAKAAASSSARTGVKGGDGWREARRHFSALPLRRFAVPGACEAAAQLLLMRSASQLPGAMLPLLAQTTLAWSLLWRGVVLRAAPTRAQALGVGLVAAGVALASAAPASAAAAFSSAAASPDSSSRAANVALCVLSFAFPALATILKEGIFRDAAAALSSGGGGGDCGCEDDAKQQAASTPSRSRRRNQPQQQQQLDVLVVNLLTSAFQAAFVLALLPLAAAARGVPFSDVPALLQAGAKQLWCGSPGLLALVPLAYVGVNIAFNVLTLGLVRAVGAVPTALTSSALVPLTVAAFSLPLPLLPPPSSLGPLFWPGTALTILGLAAYNGAAEPGVARSWFESSERRAEAAEAARRACSERRAWQRAADAAASEAEAAAAGAAAAAARLAALKCDDAEVVGGWPARLLLQQQAQEASVVVLPVVPPQSPLHNDSGAEASEAEARPAVPSP
jgi:hypothetical protein